jgi:chemotaxis protein MotB
MSRALPWLIVALMAVVIGTLAVDDADERTRTRDQLAHARDESAEFRQAYFKSQAAMEDIDRERASQAATLQQLATHVSEKAAADLDQQKLMDDLKKKIDAKEGDVSAANQIVTVHLADEILFGVGEAELSKHGKEVLTRLGDVLKPLNDKQILVGGHTDDQPIHTARFASNWELSTARAVNVVHHLTDVVGVDPHKLTAAGYSQYHPRGADRAKNRRIEILLIPSVAGPSTPPKAPEPPKADAKATEPKAADVKAAEAKPAAKAPAKAPAR